MHQPTQIQPRARRARANRIPCLLTAIVLAGCATTTAPPEADATAEPGAWYGGGLHWSRTAAEYRAIFEQTFKLAAERLEVLADGLEPGTWAVSIDADETLIDNSQYDLDSAKRGGEFNQETWHEWVLQMAAPALPGAAVFTMRVQELGGIVAVVTNRRVHQCAPTAENLRRVEIAFDIALCRTEDVEKEPRWNALQDGTAASWPGAQFASESPPGAVEVLMWVGDNIGDFPDLDQSLRNRKGSLSEFGDRYFALPNPMYGSWEDNPKE